MLADAVEGRSALHGDASRRHLGELDRVVRLGKDGLGHVLSDLAAVDVERGDDLDVTDVIGADLDIHQAGNGLTRLGVLVVVQTLNERRGAIADPDDGNTNGRP